MLRITCLGLGLTFAASAAAEIAVFHSPSDDGQPAPPGFVLAPGAHTLHLWVEAGASASSADPCDAGDGEELCGYQLELEASGATQLDGFAAANGAAFAIAPGRLRVVAGDAVTGQLGAAKLGDLTIESDDAGGVALAGGKALDAALALAPLSPAPIVAVPEPAAGAATLGAFAALLRLARRRRALAALAISLAIAAPAPADLDADGIEDAEDVCPTRYDPGQQDSGGLDGASPNGVGDACECGDVDGDGVVDLVDVARLQRHEAALETVAAPAKCPGEACDEASIALLRQALADETPPAACAASTALACFDPYEPNDVRAASRYLGSYSDAGPGGSLVATLPPGDGDWFSFRLQDDLGAFEPFALVSTPAADYDLCFYIDCDNGQTANVECTAGTPATQDGIPGCCSTSPGTAGEQVEATLSCGGLGSSEDSVIFVRVFRAASTPAACGPYTLEFGG